MDKKRAKNHDLARRNWVPAGHLLGMEIEKAVVRNRFPRLSHQLLVVGQVVEREQDRTQHFFRLE